MISNKLDFADSGLAAFIDGKNEVHAPIRQIYQPLGDRGFVAAILLIRVLDSADVRIRGRLVVGGMRLRLRLDFKLLRFDLFVAFERNPVDDLRAARETDDNLAILHSRADV